MKEWFYTITQSMLDLGLRGTDLLVFAVLYGYIQKGSGCYFDTRETIAERTGVKSIRTIDEALARLLDKGLIARTTVDNLGRRYAAFVLGERAKIALSIPQKLQDNPAKSAVSNPQNLRVPYNNVENKRENKEKVNGEDFVPPTVAQVREYADAHGFRSLDAEHFVEFYDSLGWKQKNGKHITSWKNAVITWKKRDLDKGIDIASPIKAAAPLHKSDRAYNDAETFLNSYDK